MEPRILHTEPENSEPSEPEVATQQEDLDPAAWLSQDDTNVTGYVSVDGKRLKVGALTQGEMEQLRRGASSPNPRDVKGEKIINTGLLNRLVIAAAISKANGMTVMPDQLSGKLTGDLTKIAKRVLALSGVEEMGERHDELPFVLPS